MIQAFQEYFKWQERFEYRGSDEAGIKARFWLAEIRRQAMLRRKEIQAKREQRKTSRKGMRGKPLNITK
jgi:hypothetical protein